MNLPAVEVVEGLIGLALAGAALMLWGLSARVRGLVRGHRELFRCRACDFTTIFPGYMAMHNLGHVAEAANIYAQRNGEE